MRQVPGGKSLVGGHTEAVLYVLLNRDQTGKLAISVQLVTQANEATESGTKTTTQQRCNPVTKFTYVIIPFPLLVSELPGFTRFAVWPPWYDNDRAHVSTIRRERKVWF
jgi:hypothetical protein